MAEPATQPARTESMEDILQSIKRIIENDNAESGPRGGASDVLELTQVLQPDDTVTTIPPLPQVAQGRNPAEAMRGEDVIASIDSLLAPHLKEAEAPPFEPVFSPPAPFSAPAPAPMPQVEAMSENLVSDMVRQATLEALKPLAQARAREASVPPTRAGTTVEELLMESLRPLLKSWLDTHLPAIVQQIVEKEINRILAGA
jgi:cell pole-organizing protein PopZ